MDYVWQHNHGKTQYPRYRPVLDTADDKAKNRHEEAKYSFLKLARWEIPITDHIGPRPQMISISNRNDKQLENNVLLLCR